MIDMHYMLNYNLNEMHGINKSIPKKGRGRPMFVPTDEERNLVTMMASCGVPYPQIAACITRSPRQGICVDTLSKHFAHELLVGQAKANAKVAQSLYQQAISGNVAAQIWWTKARMQWRAPSAHDNPINDDTALMMQKAFEVVFKQPIEVVADDTM